MRGASAEEGVRVRLLRAEEAQAEDVLRADGYLFAAPENLAAIAGEMKEFFDRTYYAVLERINGRPYALLVCAVLGVGIGASAAVWSTLRAALID